jgi:phosphotransferase system enzyme I (PtsI)
LKDIVRAARRHGTDVSVCGEMAGDPLYTMLLIGIGLRTLSATPSRLPYLKRVVRSVSVGECERLARTVGSFDSEGQVVAYLLDQARKRFPELVGGRAADLSS